MPVLLVCRQIHDEYLETTLPKLSVRFYMGGGYDFFNQQQFKPSSSQARILAKIKKGEGQVNWACLVPREYHEQANDQYDDDETEILRFAKPAAERFWLNLERSQTDIIVPLLHSSAHVGCLIDLNCWADRGWRQLEWYMDDDNRRVFLPSIARRWFQMLNASTKFNLKSVLPMPLYCTMPTNHGEVVANRAAREHGETTVRVKPECEASEEW